MGKIAHFSGVKSKVIKARLPSNLPYTIKRGNYVGLQIEIDWPKTTFK